MGRNSHVSQSAQQQQPLRALSSSVSGERRHGSHAEECWTLALYSEQGRPPRVIVTAVVGTSSKPQSQACFEQPIIAILLSSLDTSVGLTHDIYWSIP